MSDSQTDHTHPSTEAATQLTAVSCNRCGGTLDVGERTSYTTCGYCGTQLRVERSATSLATVELDELRNRTDDLERNVSALRSDKRVAQLDRQWDVRRAELSVPNGEHEPRLPTLHGAVFRLLPALAPLVLFASGQLAPFGTAVLPAVGAASLFGLFQAGTEGYKYNQYREERSLYQEERASLLAENV